MVNDIISDLITRIRNGVNAKRLSIKVLHSKNSLNILRVLYNEGYIRGYKEIKVETNQPHIEVFLKYVENIGVFQKLKRCSKPGCRVYVNLSKLKDLSKKARGVFVLSTPQGILTHKDALIAQVGGELLFEIW